MSGHNRDDDDILNSSPAPAEVRTGETVLFPHSPVATALGDAVIDAGRVQAVEDDTRTLSPSELRLHKPAHAAIARLSRDTHPDLPDSPPPDVPDLRSTGRPDLPPRNVPTNRITGPRPSSAAIASLQERPTKRTVRAERPALAGTGTTETYGDESRDDIRSQIAQAKAARASAIGASQRLVVQINDSKGDTTWVGGSGEPPPARPRVQRCVMSSRTRAGYTVERPDGTSFGLPADRILGVAVVALVGHPRPGEDAVFLDLVTSWGAGSSGAVVLRFDVARVPLRRLLPDEPVATKAIADLAAEIADRSGARKLGDALPWPGPPFQRFVNEVLMNRTLYGRSASD